MKIQGSAGRLGGRVLQQDVHMLHVLLGEVHVVHKRQRVHHNRHRRRLVLLGGAEGVRHRGRERAAHSDDQLGRRLHAPFGQSGRLRSHRPLGLLLARHSHLGCE